MLQEGDPPVSGGTKYPGIPCTPPGHVHPCLGRRPGDKGSGDLEKILGFSLSTLVVLPTWGSNLASLGAFGSQTLPGNPSPKGPWGPV